MSNYQPGEVWETCKKILEKRDIKEADLLHIEQFLPHLLPSDMKLMLRRIAAKRSELQARQG